MRVEADRFNFNFCAIHKENADRIHPEKCFVESIGWPNKVFRLNMGQWKFLLIQQNIFLSILQNKNDA